jgi:phosphatidylserine/phosphatidylglycerophosphate/cardiolipin synthase-like enzyme
MKRLLAACLLLCLLPGCDTGPRTLPPMEIYFSPKGGCTEAVVREIESSQSSILVQAYSFTSAPIAKALVEAHRRGIDIRAILDHKQATEEYSEADFLQHAGIPVLIDSEHAIAHNKVMIVDRNVVITGSFNFTKQAEHSNAENLLVIRDQATAEKYLANWALHAAHSPAYTGKPPKPAESAPKHSANPGHRGKRT